MSQGPILIFDKSVLQSLNPDESVWLDHFFLTNITPLFFVETLADLEKEVRSGKSPEAVVGNLAYKTPDMGSRPNVHHSALLTGELLGVAEIEMRGRPIISGGKTVPLEGKTGIFFKQAPEEEALQRWQRGEFLELERSMAKSWRRALSEIDFTDIYNVFRTWFDHKAKPKTLSETKSMADDFIDDVDQEHTLQTCLNLIGASQKLQEQSLKRWHAGGKQTVRSFFPYFAYVCSIDLFFYLAIASDLISRSRPSNKIDVAYLYYLPFCMAFSSSDTLHANIVPLFLRTDQTFVAGPLLKADLARLDEYYSAMPEDTKAAGLFRLAPHPPFDNSFLITQLWDNHLPMWREHHQRGKVEATLSPERNKELREEIKRLRESAPGEALNTDSDEADTLVIERKVRARKGKWNRFSPEVEAAAEKY